MDQPTMTSRSARTYARTSIGRIIVAVILGEAIWNLVVSLMNNLVVPWLGDVMGQSSGLPTSFTQRPYNYPDLFVSVVELCIAGLVAAILNYFFQRSKTEKENSLQSTVRMAPVRTAPVVPQDAAAPAILPATQAQTQPAQLRQPSPQAVPNQTVSNQAPQTQSQQGPPASPVVESAPPPEPEPIVPAPAAIPPSLQLFPPPQASRSAAVPPPTTPAANPRKHEALAPPPKADLAKSAPNNKKPKEIYYNIVGEAVPSDDD